MKLVVAIVNSEEEAELLDKLNNRGWVPRLASTGGFLRRGNTTLIMGVQDDQVPPLLDLLKSYSQQKKWRQSPAKTTKGFLK